MAKTTNVNLSFIPIDDVISAVDCTAGDVAQPDVQQVVGYVSHSISSLDLLCRT